MAAKSYKIKINPERTLGPLDIERVRALVHKGLIQGTEQTSTEPFIAWKAFSAFPELAELILNKMERDSKHPTAARSSQIKNAGSAETKTITSEQTKTMAQTSLTSPTHDDSDDSLQMPTLVDIKVDENPDLEKTMIDLPSPQQKKSPPNLDDAGGATKILKLEEVKQVIEKHAPPPLGEYDDEPTTAGAPPKRRRMLTKRTAIILAIGVMVMGYLSSQQEEQNASDASKLSPRFFSFPYVEVNSPPAIGGAQDISTSMNLVEKVLPLYTGGTPLGYAKAIHDGFYPAVSKASINTVAKSYLASAYIRLLESIPKDERFYKTVKSLLEPVIPSNQQTPEYTAALAEYWIMLQRYAPAQELLDEALKVRTSPELYYQRARIYLEKGEIDNALGAMNKALGLTSEKSVSPVHLLLYAQLLEKKGLSPQAEEAGKRLIKDFPDFGAGIFFRAKQLFQANNLSLAKSILAKIIFKPQLVDRFMLNDVFILMGKILDAQNDNPTALAFAEAARGNFRDQDAVDDLIFRLRAKNPNRKDVYNYILQARQKEKSKEWELAINYYIRAHEANIRDPMPNYLLGKLYEKNGKITEAIDRYKKVREADPKFIDAIIALTDLHIGRYEFEDAKQLLAVASIIKTRKDSIDFLRAKLVYRSGTKDAGVALFKKALADGSRIPELYTQVGEIESDEKNPNLNRELAEFYFANALRYDPLNAKAILGEALCHFYLDSPTRAISFLKDKLAAQPNSAAIMTSLAIVYLKSGDKDSGKNYLQNAIRSDAKYAQAFKLLGDLTRDEGRNQNENIAQKKQSYRYALASYAMYSKLVPTDPEGYMAAAELYFDVRDLGAAAQNYYKVLDLAPNYPRAHLQLAKISINGGDTDKGLALIADEIKVNPNSSEAYVEKGRALLLKKDFSAATRAYTEGIQRNDKDSDALLGLAIVHFTQGSYDNAITLLDRVLKLDPLKAEAHRQLGLIYQRTGNKPKAITAFTNFRELIRTPDGISFANRKLMELSK